MSHNKTKHKVLDVNCLDAKLALNKPFRVSCETFIMNTSMPFIRMMLFYKLFEGKCNRSLMLAQSGVLADLWSNCPNSGQTHNVFTVLELLKGPCFGSCGHLAQKESFSVSGMSLCCWNCILCIFNCFELIITSVHSKVTKERLHWVYAVKYIMAY